MCLLHQSEKSHLHFTILDDGSPMPNQWNIVHSVALNEEAKLLCGADRENSRIQCFNSDTGAFLRQIYVEKKDKTCPIYAIEFAPQTNGVYSRETMSNGANKLLLRLGTILFAVTGGDQIAEKKVYMIDAQSGEILTSFDANPVSEVA
jgi:hypothetical protein